MSGGGFTARLWSALTGTSTRDVMVMPDSTISHAALRDGIARWCGAFDAAGLVPGDRG